jgi:NTE family protein
MSDSGTPHVSNAAAEGINRRVGLVLGAGGMVGLAYHAGVLRALERHSGLSPARADVIVGTSAGSVATAYIRSGYSVDELWDLALGTHPALEGLGATPEERRAATAFTPSFASPGQFAGRVVGAGVAVARSVTRLPIPRVPDRLHPLVSGGLFTMERAAERFEADLSSVWPQSETAICAVDLGSGRRTVFGPASSPVSLSDAVQASCSIPGFYVPKRSGGRTFVDGGVHSPTNLDVASRLGCDLIVGIAPMAYDPDDEVAPWVRLARRIGHGSLRSEARIARARGAEVLLIRPTMEDITVQGLNFMRASGAEPVAKVAYEVVSRLLETDRFRLTLDDLGQRSNATAVL